VSNWGDNPKLETVRAGSTFRDSRGDLYRLDRHGDGGLVHVTRLDGEGAGHTTTFAACASAVVVERPEELTA